MTPQNDLTPEPPELLQAMPLAAHLMELRKRLLWVFAFFVVAFIGSYFLSEPIFQYLVSPLANLLKNDQGRRLIYTGLPEAFLTYVKVSLFSAFILTFPLLSYQIWHFVVPGLYQREKHLFKIVVAGAPFLFLLGGAFAFYLVIPQAWSFFLSFETTTTTQTSIPIQLEARISEYLSMTLTMVLAFALCFQLPLILYVLGWFGVITKESLRKARKYSFVGILILSAALTPPDVLSMLALALPLYLLYEGSIFFVARASKKEKS